MNAPVCQRWREHRSSYRPAGEPIVTSRYEVAPIAGDNEAKAFVLANHYAATYPAARVRVGLYRSSELVGVAVFSHPANDKVLACLPGMGRERVELGRFVLLDDVPGNGETYFLGRCFDLLRREHGIAGVVSFSDPVPRSNAQGEVLFKGHFGTIYQAHNGIYTGRGTARTLRLLPDGTVFSARAIQKVRARERGWRYSAALLEAHGAAALDGGDSIAWLATWLPRLTRPLKHPGNFRYVWALEKRGRKQLPAALPYPKFDLDRRAA